MKLLIRGRCVVECEVVAGAISPALFCTPAMNILLPSDPPACQTLLGTLQVFKPYQTADTLLFASIQLRSKLTYKQLFNCIPPSIDKT